MSLPTHSLQVNPRTYKSEVITYCLILNCFNRKHVSFGRSEKDQIELKREECRDLHSSFFLKTESPDSFPDLKRVFHVRTLSKKQKSVFSREPKRISENSSEKPKEKRSSTRRTAAEGSLPLRRPLIRRCREELSEVQGFRGWPLTRPTAGRAFGRQRA